jgi:RNA polymerase sigma-70 factor (ECF subfamily)
MNEEVEYDSGINIEDELIKKEMIEKTHNCLTSMPLLYKEPLSLFYLDEKTYEEISDILRIPVNTVGTRISRAKSIMKKLCEKSKK